MQGSIAAQRENIIGVITQSVNIVGSIDSNETIFGEVCMTNPIATIPTPDVSGQISAHNTSTTSHNDLRLLISELAERLNALANSDDTTLDQMSEVVAYIKDNRELIEAVTTAKVNVTDIIDNLTTNVSDRPLSAAQGVALKQLVDGLTTTVSGKLDASALTEAVNTALAQAKESGEFNGAAGQNGEDGYTPVKGVDYFDGEDGISCTHEWEGTVLKITSASGTSSVDLRGPQGPAYTLTDVDKQAIVDAVIGALPVYAGEVVNV